MKARKFARVHLKTMQINTIMSCHCRVLLWSETVLFELLSCFNSQGNADKRFEDVKFETVYFNSLLN